MTSIQAPQQGATESPSPTRRVAAAHGQQDHQAPRIAVAARSPSGRGYAAAFGDASGSAVVFRDLASI